MSLQQVWIRFNDNFVSRWQKQKAAFRGKLKKFSTSNLVSMTLGVKLSAVTCGKQNPPWQAWGKWGGVHLKPWHTATTAKQVISPECNKDSYGKKNYHATGVSQQHSCFVATIKLVPKQLCFKVKCQVLPLEQDTQVSHKMFWWFFRMLCLPYRVRSPQSWYDLPYQAVNFQAVGKRWDFKRSKSSGIILHIKSKSWWSPNGALTDPDTFISTILS